MFRSIIICFVILSIADASAQASTLSLRWRDTADDTISILPLQTAVLEVVMEIPAVDQVAGVSFSLQPTVFDSVTQVANGSPLPNWTVENATTPNPIGSANFVVSANDPFADSVGGGLFVLGTIVLRLESVGYPTGTVIIAFDPLGHHNVINPDGSLATFTSNINGYASYSGYWTFGKGWPFVHPGLPYDPLYIRYAIPEPASFALLGASGLAILMRQRR